MGEVRFLSAARAPVDRDGPPQAGPAGAEPPLVVDLDGTLLRTDTLMESLFALVKQRPGDLPQVLAALRDGRAAFKDAVARRVLPDVATLPVNDELLAYLRAQKEGGRRLVLATAADGRIAGAVAAHFGLFDDVLASDGRLNLGGWAKRDRLVQVFGERGFDYAGDSDRDAPVWAAARRAVVVGDAATAPARVPAGTVLERTFDDAPAHPLARATTWLHELRASHWVKNLLVLAPAFLAHRLDEAEPWAALLAFCAAASSVYVLNDLLDLPADRRHPTKRERPFASGRLPLAQALVAAPLLGALALALGAALGAGALLLLAGYVAVMATYSLRLKHRRYVDAAVLGAGYTSRLALGALALGQTLDPWLAAWCAPTFFGLALLKRRAELAVAQAHPPPPAPSHRPVYTQADGVRIAQVGQLAGWLGCAALVLRPQPADVVHGLGLWPAGLLMVAWADRLWRLAAAGHIAGDPVTFALRDRASQVFGLIGLIFVLALA